MAESNPTSDAPVPPADDGSVPPEAAATPPETEAKAQAAPEPGAPGEETAEAANPGTDAQELDPVTALEVEVAQWKDVALRARADLDNFRKRMSVEKTESIRYANQSLFESLLPVLDNFHFGLEAARSATDPQGVLMGMEMVLKQFQDFLESQNVTAIPAEPGTVFDPNVHEAMAQEHDPEVPEGAILKVIRAGYRMGERLVRASNVVVSKGPEQTD